MIAFSYDSKCGAHSAFVVVLSGICIFDWFVYLYTQQFCFLGWGTHFRYSVCPRTDFLSFMIFLWGFFFQFFFAVFMHIWVVVLAKCRRGAHTCLTRDYTPDICACISLVVVLHIFDWTLVVVTTLWIDISFHYFYCLNITVI